MEESDTVQDAKLLHELIKAKNKDDEKLIKLVTSRTIEERLKIKDEYNSTFQADLNKDIEKEYSSHFKEVLLTLFCPPLDYDCYHIRKAVKGLGTDEDALIEILSTRTPETIEQMKVRYKEIYPGRDMVADIKDDTSGSFWKVLSALLQTNRGDNENPDVEECTKLAKMLYEAGITKKNTAEIFTKILTEKSKNEIFTIAKIYRKIAGSHLLKDLSKFFSGDTKNAFIGILYGILSPSEYFAKLVNESVKGLGTKNTTLIRILVSRYEKDLPNIKQFYKQFYNKDMVEDIKNDTSGSYQRILMELCMT